MSNHIWFFLRASALLFFTNTLSAAEIGIPVQLRLKSPAGIYVSDSNVTISLQVLSPSTSCILREEIFSAQNIIDGQVSLVLGAGARGVSDPNIALVDVFDNTVAKSGLKCVDASGNIVAVSQTYTPTGTDNRKIRFSATVTGTPLLVDFPMDSVSYAKNAEAVGGKRATDLLTQNLSTQLTQTNLESLLGDNTKFSNLLNIANGGAVGSATNATTAVNFSGAVAGDVSGTQSALSVDKIKGIAVSATAPTTGQVLQYNGTQYVPVAIPSAPVTSVAGRTGAVTLSNTDISGLGGAAVLNVGTTAGTVAAGNDSRITGAFQSSTALAGDLSGTLPSVTVSTVGGKTAAQVATSVTDTMAAVATATASTLMKRDASGNAAVNSLSATATSVKNIYLYEATNTNYIQFKAPTTVTNYALTLPGTLGSAGQTLVTDATGNLSWATPALAAPSGVTAGTYGSATTSASFVVDTYGKLTSASSVAIALPPSQITQAAATSGQVLKWSGSAWAPAADNNSGGTVTNVSSANSYLSVATATTTPVLTLNVGTVANTVAAGNDSRITGALQSTTFNSYVAAASCSSVQTMYWNSVSGTFQCQTIGTVTNATTAVNFSGSVAGDVSGTQSALSVDKIKGIAVSATAPTTGQVLQYNGTQYVPVAIPSAPVTSVAGRTGVITLSNSDISGLGGAAVLNVGTAAGTVAAGNDSRITGAFQSSTALGGDLSGTLPNPVLASVVTAGTSTKVTYDAKGRVTSGGSLLASDIPSLDTSILTSGILPVSRGGTGASALTANGLVLTNGTGTALTSVTCATNQVMYWTGTAWACTSLSSLMDLSLGATQGQIAYRNATGWTSLPVGTAGQFLKTNGAGSDPAWASHSTVFSGNGNSTSVAAASSYIFSFSGIAPKTSVTAANHGLVVISVPKAGTLSNLAVTFSAAAAATFKCTLYTGATTAAMAATTLAVTGNGTATFLTSTGSITVAAGTLLDLVCANTAGSASVIPVAYSIEYTNP